MTEALYYVKVFFVFGVLFTDPSLAQAHCYGFHQQPCIKEDRCLQSKMAFDRPTCNGRQSRREMGRTFQWVPPNNAPTEWGLLGQRAIWKDSACKSGNQRMIQTTTQALDKYWDIHRSMGRIIAFPFKIRVASTHVPREFDGSLSAAPNSLCIRWHFLAI